MNDIILTVITFSISNDNLRKDFETFLEKTCRARKVVDQSTYVSPLEKEDIVFNINLKNFLFGDDDHVTLYYCAGNSANSSIPLTEHAVVRIIKSQNN